MAFLGVWGRALPAGDPERVDDPEEGIQILGGRVGGETDHDGPVLVGTPDRDGEETDLCTGVVVRDPANRDRGVALRRAVDLGRDGLGGAVRVRQLPENLI